jgi:hypothetical protein
MLDVIHFIRLIKISIATLMVVASGATAMAFIGHERAPHVATELANGAPQSVADRFRTEFAEWPVRPRQHRGHPMPLTD